MVKTSVLIDDAPSAFRYPRGEATGMDMPELIKPLEIGRGRIIREGTQIALLSLGTRLEQACLAADMLDAEGLSTTVADARFMKPLDTQMIDELVKNHDVIVTIEEGSVGGFGAHVLHYLAQSGQLDKGVKIRTLTLPDNFIDHDKPEKMYEIAGLNAQTIMETARQAVRGGDDALVALNPNAANPKSA